MHRPKIVADTNVLVSGLLWVGSPHKIIKLAEDKHVTLYSSLPIVEELSDVLLRPKFMPRLEEMKATPEALIESLISIMEVIHPVCRISLVRKDPDDNKIIECAVSARADFIVSGDPHLLELKECQGIRIVLPAELINKFCPNQKPLSW